MSEQQIKDIIKEKVLIERLELEDMEADEIMDADPLFGDEGLALDSVEALDVAAGIEQEFDIKLPRLEQEETQKNFYSVDNLAAFVSTLLLGRNE